MRPLLAFADAVDWLSEQLGQALKWLVLFSSLVSAFNALMRYTIHYSSNAWLANHSGGRMAWSPHMGNPLRMHTETRHQ